MAVSAGLTDPVAERWLPLLMPSWRVALLLAVDPEWITARTGVGDALTTETLENVEISLADPTMLRRVIDNRRPHVGDAVDEQGRPREPWLGPLLAGAGRELAIAPVVVGDRVARILVALGARVEIGTAAGEVIRVARSMVAAYLRAAP